MVLNLRITSISGVRTLQVYHISLTSGVKDIVINVKKLLNFFRAFDLSRTFIV